MNQMIQKIAFSIGLILLAWMNSANANNLITDKEFGEADEIIIHFTSPINAGIAQDIHNYTVYERPDPDIRLKIKQIHLSEDKKTARLIFSENLNQNQTYIVSINNIGTQGQGEYRALSFEVSKPYFGYLFTIMITALLIKNFVFTKYLGLCVFFGTSRKKDTAQGMGIVFTIVMVASAIMSWLFFQFILKPFNLNFLQIVIFIGMVSLTIQAVDTVLRKVNPALFKSFGIYLVLVIANCVVIAVPLTLAKEDYNFMETLMLSFGAGSGFLLALYLMASVRERLDIAKVPQSFEGLPIAFIVAGQFALAFLGFSGMAIF